MGKSMVELEEYGNKLKKDVYCDETGCYLLRDVKVDDTFGKTFSVVKALVQSIATVLELFRKCVYAVPNAIGDIILWGIAISRNAGIIYEGAVYTISLNGNIWQITTLPMELDKDYDSTSAFNMTDRIGHCIDEHSNNIEDDKLTGFFCTTDQNSNWQPDIYFMRGDCTQLVWGPIALDRFFSG